MLAAISANVLLTAVVSALTCWQHGLGIIPRKYSRKRGASVPRCGPAFKDMTEEIGGVYKS